LLYVFGRGYTLPSFAWSSSSVYLHLIPPHL
jgi:hypothetical protein